MSFQYPDLVAPRMVKLIKQITVVTVRGQDDLCFSSFQLLTDANSIATIFRLRAAAAGFPAPHAIHL
jgi:hypothetical protein